MRLSLASFATVLVLSTTNASAQFAFDMSADELRAATGKLAVGDLSVGEVGIAYPTFCTKDGVLFGSSQDQLSESASDYGVNFRIKREPGSALSIQATKGSLATQFVREAVLLKLTGIAPCQFYESSGLGTPFLQITSINGLTKLTDIISSLR